MAALFDRAEKEFGGVDVVVHAAGRMALSTVAELDLDVLDALHRTNIRGTFVVDQQAARRVRPGGAIVNFSTSVVGTSVPSYGAYVASKGAVEALSLILARELRGRDVTVNAIAPGPTATDLFLDHSDQQTIDRMANAVPLQRRARLSSRRAKPTTNTVEPTTNGKEPPWQRHRARMTARSSW
jgi:3-oxoacyl-[acyl-carrier protein] reductase